MSSSCVVLAAFDIVTLPAEEIVIASVADAEPIVLPSPITKSSAIVNSPAELGNVCEEIYMCIGNDNDVREVISGENGILSSISPGVIIVDHTTTSSILSNEMSEMCLKKGVHYICLLYTSTSPRD